MNAEHDPARASQAGQVSTEERILQSAHGCFEAIGVEQTRMDDIASDAGVSRQTIYKYFSGKADIVDRMAHLEMAKVNTILRRQIRRKAPFAERLTDAIWLSVQISRENPYLMRTVADPKLMPRYTDKSAALFQWHKSQWSGFIAAGWQAGDLAADVDADQIVHWILLSQLMLLMAFDRLPLGETASRAFIRRFMVEPLIAKSGGSGSAAELDALRAENLALRDLVATQALALRAMERDDDAMTRTENRRS